MIALQWKPMVFQSSEFSELFVGDGEAKEKLWADLRSDIAGIWNRFIELHQILAATLFAAVPFLKHWQYCRVRKDRDAHKANRMELRAGYELIELSGESDHVISLAAKVLHKAQSAFDSAADRVRNNGGSLSDLNDLAVAIERATAGLAKIKEVVQQTKDSIKESASGGRVRRLAGLLGR